MSEELNPEEQEQPVKLVRSRRLARESAFQALYEIDTAETEVDEAIQSATNREPFVPEAIEYIESLVKGTVEQLEVIDEQISALLSKNWDLSRIAKVDRAILRMAFFELDHIESMPPKVTISEAVIMAKKFGSEESGRFVNGVLGKYLPSSAKAVWAPSKVGTSTLSEDDEQTPQPIEVDHMDVEEGSEEHELLRKGGWLLKRDS